jgi:hypothetical protein
MQGISVRCRHGKESFVVIRCMHGLIEEQCSLCQKLIERSRTEKLQTATEKPSNRKARKPKN